MRFRSSIVSTLAVISFCWQAASLCAEDAFFDVPFSDLKLTEGEMPKPGIAIATAFRPWLREPAMTEWAILEGPGEAWVRNNGSFVPVGPENSVVGAEHLLIRAPAGKDVVGQLAVRNPDGAGMTLVKFAVPASQASKAAHDAFYRTKYVNLITLQDRRVPGSACFRHQAELARKALKLPPGQEVPRPINAAFRNREGDIAEMYALFSGGRAVSENLQLDRPLRDSAVDQPTEDINSLQGITVAEINWKPLVKDLKPKLDPLSKLVPADQHVIFFPSFNAAAKVADEANGRDTLLFRIAEPRSEDASVKVRYEKQFGLSLSGVGRTVGPKIVGSVAVTGSDPYLLTGTDVAVIFAAEQPPMLAALLLAQMQLSAKDRPDAKLESGNVEGLAYKGFRSPDRHVCGYVAELKGAVTVTNSLAQLTRLAKVGKGTLPAIASLDEYTYFRNRYPLGDKSETAFLFLSDATIRRWCSPQWRIASARRTHTAAVLADLQAANLDTLATNKVKPGPLRTDIPLIEAGELLVTDQGVSSSTQGSLVWMTPIVEMPITKVTHAEAEAYNLWRNQYQSNWRWAFDPIAFRLTVQDDKLAGDVTVMPLILGTDYREFVAISRGAEIGPTAGDRHNALAHIILAINTKSRQMQSWGNIATTMAAGSGIDPLSWLGSSVSLYADDDPFWKELAETPPDKLEEFQRNAVGRLPVALHVEVTSTLKLAAFLTALRGFSDQAAPGLTKWETRTYREQPYVCILPSEQAGLGDNFTIYYSPSADGLTVTLNEPLLKRVIDRRLERAAAKKKGQPEDNKKSPATPSAMPWLGANFCLQVDRRLLAIVAAARADDYQAVMQVRSWSNLPILNEWKRLYPDQDPVKLHERLWYTQLICPGGGEYVWNKEWHTMQSTIYGHPGQPKSGPLAPTALLNFNTANFGLTFEEQGLRARIELNREAK